MDQATLDKANQLQGEIRQLEADLCAWEETIVRPNKMGKDEHIHTSARCYARWPFSSINEQAFVAFRQACINDLKVKLAELRQELEAL